MAEYFKLSLKLISNYHNIIFNKYVITSKLLVLLLKNINQWTHVYDNIIYSFELVQITLVIKWHSS